VHSDTDPIGSPATGDIDAIETSIVIPCYNGAPFLRDQLSAIAASADRSVEVVVSDNGSTDDSAAVALALGDELELTVRVVDASARKGINHARNVGVRAARGRFVLLCDCDDVVSPDWLPGLRGALRGGADCVGGPLVRVYPDGSVLETAEGVHFRTWQRRGVTVGSPTGANCGFTRALYDSLGGFDEEFAGGGDEIDFFYRATIGGAALRNVPEASIRYRLRDSARDAFRQNTNYGRGSVRLHRKLADAGMPRESAVKIVGTVGHSVLRLVVGPATSRRIAIERLGRRWGRLSESIATHHFYL
jgi:glycosyltransferase involved in cell wall biosynthesis